MTTLTATGTDQTPQRLIEAAARLFAENGYAATSVRDLTAAAECNLAAVNYHFGSKQGLYEQVFKDMLGALRQQRIAAVKAVLDEAVARQHIEMVLCAFAEAFLEPLIDQERGQLKVQLFMRELADPQLPSRMFIEEMVEPIQGIMVDAMSRTCPGLEPGAALLCLHSLVAQLIHLVQTRKLFAEAPRLNKVMKDLEGAVEHIIRFSAAGVQMYQKNKP